MNGLDLPSRMKSILHALNGLQTLVRTQPNAQIHLIATMSVLALAVVLGLSALEWGCLIIAVALVWLAEALNTSIEALCDVVSPEFHPQIRIAKDVAAGGVLVAAIAAILLGFVVFSRHILELL